MKSARRSPGAASNSNLNGATTYSDHQKRVNFVRQLSPTIPKRLIVSSILKKGLLHKDSKERGQAGVTTERLEPSIEDESASIGGVGEITEAAHLE